MISIDNNFTQTCQGVDNSNPSDRNNDIGTFLEIGVVITGTVLISFVKSCYKQYKYTQLSSYKEKFKQAESAYYVAKSHFEADQNLFRLNIMALESDRNINEIRGIIEANHNENRATLETYIQSINDVIRECTEYINAYKKTISWFFRGEKLRELEENLERYNCELADSQIIYTELSEVNIEHQARFIYQRLNQRSFTTITIDRNILISNPEVYLKELVSGKYDLHNLKFRMLNEMAIDQGGVTREVITLLFKSLLEMGDGSIRSILDLGEDPDVYKGLGAILCQVALNQTLFLKDYFDRDFFTIIETLSEDELALLIRGEDDRDIELIKQRLILDLNKGSSTEQINSIFKFKNLEEKTDADFKEIEELLVDVLDYDEEDLEDLRSTNPEKYKAVIEKEIDTWFKDNQHFYRQADKLIAIAMYFNKAGSLDNIVAPLDREVLATATIESASVAPLDIVPRTCIRKKIELIHDWIRTEATPEQLHQFIQFCTGASVLTEQNRIQISHGTHPFFAHTCFNRLDLSTTFEQREAPENTTEQQIHAAFIRDLEGVILPNTGAGFNAI